MHKYSLYESADSLVELSKDELKKRLQEATEVGKEKKNYKWHSFLHSTPGWQTNWWFYCVDKVIDILSCELEVAHRYLEGKYEALKILQGKVKRRTHTRTALTRVIILPHWQKSLLKVKSALLHPGHSWQGHKSHQKSVAKNWGEGQSAGKGKCKRRLL